MGVDEQAHSIRQRVDAEKGAAFAEQQRIANVIALGQFRVMPSDLPWFRHLVIQPSGDVGIDLTDEVRTGLGL